MFTSKIEDEDYYETLITDIDSRDRSLLKIITDNEFEPLMDDKDPKAENIMMSIYQGKEATRWDGSIKGYSAIYHFITTNPKKMESNEKGIKRLFKFFTNYFEANYTFDYNFQYRYRSHSIYFIFIKEFFWSIVLLVIFQYISYEYLNLFNIDKFTSDGLSGTALRTKVSNNLSTYKGYNLLAFIFSFSLIFHIWLKLIFNSLPKEK